MNPKVMGVINIKPVIMLKRIATESWTFRFGFTDIRTLVRGSDRRRQACGAIFNHWNTISWSHLDVKTFRALFHQLIVAIFKSMSFLVRNKPLVNFRPPWIILRYLAHHSAAGHFLFPHSDEALQVLGNVSMVVYPDFLSEDEEKKLLQEVEPYLKRLRYEQSHWDNVSCLECRSWCKW